MNLQKAVPVSSQQTWVNVGVTHSVPATAQVPPALRATAFTSALRPPQTRRKSLPRSGSREPPPGRWRCRQGTSTGPGDSPPAPAPPAASLPPRLLRLFCRVSRSPRPRTLGRPHRRSHSAPKRLPFTVGLACHRWPFRPYLEAEPGWPPQAGRAGHLAPTARPRVRTVARTSC